MELMLFLMKATAGSLTGVLAPGAVTTATIAQGAKNKYAGVFIAIGHGLLEIPLIFLIILGLGKFLETEIFTITVGIIGGGFLAWMGAQMIRELSKSEQISSKLYTARPTMTGFILSVLNPYFILWWASFGLNLTRDAEDLGMTAFVLFAVIHWLCDLIWLSMLSLGSFHGTSILNKRNQKVVLWICGIILIGFGIKFIYNAVALWMS